MELTKEQIDAIKQFRNALENMMRRLNEVLDNLAEALNKIFKDIEDKDDAIPISIRDYRHSEYRRFFNVKMNTRPLYQTKRRVRIRDTC